MAPNTPKSYRNLIIYEIYVRNHGPKGTFSEVEADLPRLKAMGVDIAWFMPIHPIGQLNKKGSLGCPYSIQDYRGVNPEYGTREDFIHLVQRAHDLGLKVMIDVVYNHTAHDSVLVREHPEFFHQDGQGKPFTTVPAWSDVIDLKHPNPGLTRYLIDTLVGWAQAGVDGFRCDVASIVPIEFWLQACAEVEKVKPGVIWLAESVHASFVEDRRRHGLLGFSDSEVFAAFDLCYDYDIWPMFCQVVQGNLPAQRFLELLRFQESIYPQNYVKMRCVENHDNSRIMRLARSREQALAWTAFVAFNQGAFLIYGGQEAGADHTPSLFDIDKIEWKGYPLQDFLSKLAHLKKDPAQIEGQFTLLADEPALQAAWEHPTQGLYGVFNTSAIKGEVAVQLEDGEYPELLNGGKIAVKDGKIALPENAAILRCEALSNLNLMRSPLLDSVIR
jgi:glycosidase